jgi:Cof subfamily protein (haloacid dehalogenase superfamily)
MPNRKQYKMLALDMDWTLLDNAKHMHKIDKEAVRAAAEAGIVVVFASGRMTVQLIPYAEEVGIKPYLLGYHGNVIHDWKNPAEILHPVPQNLVDEILEYAYKKRLHLNVYHDEVVYRTYDGPIYNMYKQRTGMVPPLISDNKFVLGKPCPKIMFLDFEEKTDKIYSEMKERYDTELNIFKSDKYLVEIMDKRVNKGEGLDIVCKRLSITPEEVIAVGDYENDIPMLEFAGLSVAMGNATDEVKDIADITAPPVSEQGVNWVVRKFLL